MAIAWLAVFSLSGLTGGRAAVAGPLVAALAGAAVFFTVLLRRSPRLPLDEVGLWYVGIALAYTALPLIVYLALGMEWTPFNDLRLFISQPAPAMVGRVGWHFALYLLTFAGVYLLVRGRAALPASEPPRVPGALATSAFLLWTFVTVSLLIPRLFFDLSSSDYYESYRVVQQLPLLLRQWLRLASGIGLVLELVLLLWIFGDWRNRRWIAITWLVFEAVQTVVTAGARTELMLMLVAIVFLYHRTVRPIRLSVAVAGALVALVGFTALGYYRNYRMIQDAAALSTPVSAGEFESVFANAVDIYERKAADELGDIPPGLTMSDLVAPIPSQLLPFPKSSMSDWYLGRFYLSVQEQGGGLAFGVVPQSMLGAGIPELLLRAALVGFLFGWATRVAARNPRRLWVVIGYLWLTLYAYQSIRASTFHALSDFTQQFLPAVVLLEGTRLVLVAGTRGRGVRRPALRTAP